MKPGHPLVDQRLNDIDDCLYRVAARVLVVQNKKVLLIREAAEGWWALPGGGVDHGESVKMTVLREVEEELGVPAAEIISDFEIVYYNIGSVINGVPRMNLFFMVSVPESSLKQTVEVAERQWCGREAFMQAELHDSFNKDELAAVLFDT